MAEQLPAGGNRGFRCAGLVSREGGAPLRGEFGMRGVAPHAMVLNVDMHVLTDLEARRGDGNPGQSPIFPFSFGQYRKGRGLNLWRLDDISRFSGPLRTTCTALS